jgi:ABC-type uncharacterized transport system fused permease/ATPase subunit
MTTQNEKTTEKTEKSNQKWYFFEILGILGILLAILESITNIWGKEIHDKLGNSNFSNMIWQFIHIVGIIMIMISISYLVTNRIIRKFRNEDLKQMTDNLIKTMQIVEKNNEKILDVELYTLIFFFEMQYVSLMKEITPNEPINEEHKKQYVKGEIMKKGLNVTGIQVNKAIDKFYNSKTQINESN